MHNYDQFHILLLLMVPTTIIIRYFNFNHSIIPIIVNFHFFLFNVPNILY